MPRGAAKALLVLRVGDRVAYVHDVGLAGQALQQVLQPPFTVRPAELPGGLSAAAAGLVQAHAALLQLLGGQGLGQAARARRAHLGGAIVKRLQRVDAACAELRH